MKRYLKPTQLIILAGLAVGLLAAATVLEIRPGILGWVLGAGLGLMGGAFVAAIMSGDQLVSGPAPKRGSVASAPWLTATPDKEASDGAHEAGDASDVEDAADAPAPRR
jgi:hypothetical protein